MTAAGTTAAGTITAAIVTTPGTGADVLSRDPRTGGSAGVVAREHDAAQVAAIGAAAAAAAPALDALGRAGRARLLRDAADALDAAGDRIVALADRESALGPARLTGELARTTVQLRLFASVAEEGSYTEAVLDDADPAAAPPRPDLRRMLVPTGPVAVFAASNFPLAFSVPGGDTASALAAGCPVVVKAHPAHPALSELCAELLRGAVGRAGLPDGTVGLVHGTDAGRALVGDPHVTAVGFTGSLAGGRALFDLACARPDPVPFYGELSSLNPVVVTRAAAAERGAAIGSGLAGSVLLGSGQLCTKPGLVLLPAGAGGDAVRAALVGAAAAQPAAPLLNEGITAGFRRGVDELAAGADALLPGTAAPAGTWVSPAVFRMPAAALTRHARALDEVFGPVTVLVDYADDAERDAAVALLPGALTATVHAGDGEDVADLLAALRPIAGRLVFDGFPTGVAVTWSMQHGGPWPATTSALHTSVGATAIRRWLRPVTYQDVPARHLPEELRDGNPAGIARRRNGRPEER